MMTNETMLEQRSDIKFLVAEKYKSYEIYRRMCDMYRETCFSQNIYSLAEHGFITMNVSRKGNSWSGNTLTLWKREHFGYHCQERR